MSRDVLSELQQEAKELGIKLANLNTFLARKDAVCVVGSVQYHLLLQQKQHMENYAMTLRQRIANLEL